MDIRELDLLIAQLSIINNLDDELIPLDDPQIMSDEDKEELNKLIKEGENERSRIEESD